jgi:Protein of unknown function (DUF4232)
MDTRVATAVTVGVAVVVLAGCGPRSLQGQAAPSTASTSSRSSGTPAPTTGAPTRSAAPVSSPSPGLDGRPTRCLTTHLGVSLAETGAAAGSVYDTIRLTNSGAAACTLHGYPGVSLVGHGNGTQIGAPARPDHGFTPKTVTVPSGASTTFIVQVTRAANYPTSDCSPAPADGLRIYPPGDTTALYLPLRDITGCARTTVDVLTVRPVGSTV